MQRKQSTFFETYYIYNKGARYMTIFRDQEDHEYFCSLINKYAEQQRVTIFAYNLCDYCFHMLVRAERGNFNDISLLFKLSGSMYGRYFNRKSKTVYNKPRHGVIFAAKFESIPINDAEELRKYIVDIHKEEEGDLSVLKDSEFCSYGKYLDEKKFEGKGININTSYFQHASKEELMNIHEGGYIKEDKGIDIHQGDYFLSYGVFVRKNDSN